MRKLGTLHIGLIHCPTPDSDDFRKKRAIYFVSLELADLYKQYNCIIPITKRFFWKMNDMQMFYTIMNVRKGIL